MIEALFALLFEGLGELILQLLFEVIFRTAASFITPPEYRMPPWATLIGWTCIGCILGFISLAIIPQYMIRHAILRALALFVMPSLLGIMTWAFGRFQDAHERIRLPLDTFWYGFGFGFTFSLVRLVGAQ